MRLNSDIKSTRSKGIIAQYLTKSNPRRFKNMDKREISQEFDEFFKQTQDTVFLLLGEAGSGKSLSLQMKFLEDLKAWQMGKPLPIFFNLADEVDLGRVFRRINANVGCILSPDFYRTEILVHRPLRRRTGWGPLSN